MKKKKKKLSEENDNVFVSPQRSSLSFEELQGKYLLTDSEREKRKLLRQMSNKATTFENWLFTFGHAKEQNVRFKSEKKLVKSANTVSELLLIVQSYKLSRSKQISAIEKALRIANNGKEFKSLQQICADKGMMLEYSREETKRALIEALN